MSDKPEVRIGRLFQHAGTYCLVTETDLGIRNGYMRIPEDHPWYQPMMDIEVPPPTNWDEIQDATGVPIPKSMRDRSEDYENRREIAWYDDWMNARISIHGGWTYAGLLTKERFDFWFKGGGGDGVPPGLWVGFDTGHAYDGRDKQLMQELGVDQRVIDIMSSLDGHVWSIDEVAAEISRAAEEMQAARILAAVSG